MRASSPAQQGGMALLAAIFMVVVLAGIGVAAARLSSSQQQAVTMNLQVLRAEAAAESGLEFLASRALLSSVCLNLNLPLTQAALRNFTLVLNCASHASLISGVSYPVYELSASAQYGVYGHPDYVFRRVSRTVSLAP